MKTENMVSKQILILCLVYFFFNFVPFKNIPNGGGNPRFLRRLKTPSKHSLRYPKVFYTFQTHFMHFKESRLKEKNSAIPKAVHE